MRIKFVGHSCFLLTSEDGIRIVTDPYEHAAYDGAVKYRPVDEEAEIVLITHGHPDHNYTANIRGEPEIISSIGDQTVAGIDIMGVPSFHDTSKGSERGSNIIFRVVIDGISVCHLGDLGHIIDEKTAVKIKPVDVLLIPVGGFFTIGKDESDSIIQIIDPDLVIPMHFKTAGVDFPIAPVDDFLESRQNVTRDGSSEVELAGGSLPSGILVLDPAAVP